MPTPVLCTKIQRKNKKKKKKKRKGQRGDEYLNQFTLIAMVSMNGLLN